MSSRLTLPHSQQRHSNVAVVRLTNGSSRIEVACYKNKVIAFRNGAESEIDEVVQIERIFSSVSRGEFASKSEIANVIGAELSNRDAIKHVLQHGTLQVASGERSMSSEEMLRDVCTIVAQKVVHPTTKRPYTALFIADAMKAAGITLRLDQPAKKQAMQAVKTLCSTQVVPVMRAQMRLQISADVAELAMFAPTIVAEGNPLTIDIDPEHFRAITELSAAKGWTCVVVDYAVCDSSVGDANAFAAATAEPKAESKRDRRQKKRKSASDSDSDS